MDSRNDANLDKILGGLRVKLAIHGMPWIYIWDAGLATCRGSWFATLMALKRSE